MQRLEVGQSVLVMVGQRLAVCRLTGFADGAAVLTPTERQRGGPMPEFSPDAQLTFEHGPNLVMLNGTLRRDDEGTDLVFAVSDGVQVPPRRRDSRVQVELPVVVQPASGEPQETTTTDVSATGLGVKGTGHGEQGNVVGVRLTLADETVIAVRATVVRVIGEVTALRIESFEEGSAEPLRRYVLDVARSADEEEEDEE
jgi:hypothetical protein